MNYNEIKMGPLSQKKVNLSSLYCDLYHNKMSFKSNVWRLFSIQVSSVVMNIPGASECKCV